VLTVTAGTYTPMDAELTLLLHTCAELLYRAVREIEESNVGGSAPLSSMVDLVTAFEGVQPAMPEVLQGQIRRSLERLDFRLVFAEIGASKTGIGKEPLAALRAVLLLAGHKKKDVKEWAKVQKVLKKAKAIADEMGKLAPAEGLTSQTAAAKASQKRWEACDGALAELDLESVAADSSQALIVLVRWLRAVRIVRQLALAVPIAAREPPADAAAESMFTELDKDASGSLEAQELVVGLLTRFKISSAKAQSLLRALDGGGDGKVSLKEWLRGWASGSLAEVKKVSEQSDQGGGGKGGASGKGGALSRVDADSVSSKGGARSRVDADSASAPDGTKPGKYKVVPVK